MVETAEITIKGIRIAVSSAYFSIRPTAAGMNISGIISSYMEEDTTKILFSEIPGIIIQVSESDMDYLDSQLLLQDIAYYPLGKPSTSFKGVRISRNVDATVAGILASLMDMASEGED